jgi:PTH1 family peptidyl-tRNA hydrolase
MNKVMDERAENLDLALMDRIVVGLGNPGDVYTHTRHNLGFRALDAFLKSMDIRKDFQPYGKARVQVADIEGIQTILVRPSTFMNLSGNAVAGILDRTGLDLSNLLVVHDEMDLFPGQAKMKPGGGAAGHAGVQNIIDRCGADFMRLKIGIGAPPDKDDEAGADWVLSEIPPDEMFLVMNIMHIVAEGIYRWIRDGNEKSMTWFNTAMREFQEEITREEEVESGPDV